MNIEKVWAEYRDSLKSFLYSRVSDADEVDDLLQEILIKTHQNLDNVRRNDSVKPWLFQIANNSIVDYYRKRARHQAVQARDLWYSESDDNDRADLSKCVEPFIRALPEESSQLLLAVDLNGISQKAYAEQLGVSYSTLKSRVQKSRSELRRLFDKCCRFELDRSGNLVEIHKKSNTCRTC